MFTLTQGVNIINIVNLRLCTRPTLREEHLKAAAEAHNAKKKRGNMITQ